MFDTPSHLAAFYGLSHEEAMAVVYCWMKTFGKGKTLDERVAVAEGSRPPYL
jgi:hypothetical protein